MQKDKNLVEEALIQMKQVEEAIAENAKGILQSTMKEEISQLVKESLSEEDEDEMEMDADVDMDDESMDTDDEMEMDMDSDMDMDMDMDSDEETIDLTDASDEEILKVFKAMGEEDGIIVKKDGSDIHLTDNDTDSEYLVKLGESMEEYEGMEFKEEDDSDVQQVIDALFSDDQEMGESMYEEDMEETMYEIEMEEDDMGMDDMGMDNILKKLCMKSKWMIMT
jgi:hypothetical protein